MYLVVIDEISSRSTILVFGRVYIIILSPDGDAEVLAKHFNFERLLSLCSDQDHISDLFQLITLPIHDVVSIL
jgi:hypothetical protein